MEIRNLYINLNACLIDLQNNQRQQKMQAGRCDDYFNCVQTNAHLIDQHERLSPEISRDFVNQHFDLNTLSSNFKRIETTDLKIRDLQHNMPEIRKFLKTQAQNIELGLQQIASNLNFEQLDEAEEWIDSVFNELERIKQERIDKREQWKSTGKAVVKNTANAIGAVSSFLWKMTNQK